MLTFVLWRFLVAVVAGFGFIILLASWSVLHFGFILLWPFFSFVVFVALLLIPFDRLRRRTSSGDREEGSA